jgi:hypothetical protein
MTEVSRRNLLAGAAALAGGTAAAHYPFPGLAYVEKTGSGYREVPAPWNPMI